MYKLVVNKAPRETHNHISKHLVKGNNHIFYLTDVYGNNDDCDYIMYNGNKNKFSVIDIDTVHVLLDIGGYDKVEVPKEFASYRALLPKALKSHFSYFSFKVKPSDYDRIISLMYKTHISGIEPYELYTKAHRLMDRFLVLAVLSRTSSVSDDAIKNDKIIKFELSTLCDKLDISEVIGTVPDEIQALTFESLYIKSSVSILRDTFEDRLQSVVDYDRKRLQRSMEGYTLERNSKLQEAQKYLDTKGSPEYLNSLKEKYKSSDDPFSFADYTEKVYKNIVYNNRIIAEAVQFIDKSATSKINAA